MADTGATGLAKLLGVSRERVYQLERERKISRNPDGSFDPAAVARQLGRNLDPQQPPKARTAPEGGQEEPAGDPDPIARGGSSHEIFNRARAAKELAIARERQLDLKLRQGQLLDLADVERTWTAGLTAIKNRLLMVTTWREATTSRRRPTWS